MPKLTRVLALKANHPTLHAQVKQWFEQHLQDGFSGITHSYDEQVEKGHHRTEKRQRGVRTRISTTTPAQSK